MSEKRLLRPHCGPAGAVGIGTTNPATKLEVDGDVTIISGSFIKQDAWQTPTFTNSWADYFTTDPNWGPVAYYRRKDGRVYLRGLIKSGTIPSTAFNLPAGYRPSLARMFNQMSSGGSCRVDVDNGGNVNIAASCTSNLWISLDNISFRVIND